MPNQRKLEAVTSMPPVPPVPGPAVPGWRDDIDPRALPPTPLHSPGQRKVLAACVELFADQGFSATSIRDIASAAGMQSASLYNHFPSKHAILSELVVLGYEYHLDRLLGAILNAGADPQDQLVAAVREHVLVHCEYACMGVVVSYELRHIEADIQQRLESVRRRSTGIVREILRRGAERGVFVDHGHHVAQLAFASMGVDAARWFPTQPELDASELADDFARLALRMVAS